MGPSRAGAGSPFCVHLFRLASSVLAVIFRCLSLSLYPVSWARSTSAAAPHRTPRTLSLSPDRASGSQEAPPDEASPPTLLRDPCRLVSAYRTSPSLLPWLAARLSVSSPPATSPTSPGADALPLPLFLRSARPTVGASAFCSRPSFLPVSLAPACLPFTSSIVPFRPRLAPRASALLSLPPPPASRRAPRVGTGAGRRHGWVSGPRLRRVPRPPASRPGSG